MCTWMPVKPGVIPHPRPDGVVNLPCNPSGPDLFSAVFAEVDAVSEISFGPITHRFVSPAFGPFGAGTGRNRQVTLPLTSLSIIKSRGSLVKPVLPADPPTIVRFPSHRPIAHSQPG